MYPCSSFVRLCVLEGQFVSSGQAGFLAEHVARAGKAGWKDWNVLRYAVAGEFVLVTNNAVDFRRLYAAEELHAGLVILLPNVARTRQQALFQAVLAELDRLGEPINQVIAADLDGDEAVLTIYELPSAKG